LGGEADDVLGVVGAVGVQADAGTGVFGDLVLIDDPFEGAAVGRAVLEAVGELAELREALTTKPASQFEGAFVSAAHSEDDIARSAGVIGEFFTAER